MNHYERLKVTQDAPPEVIRAAYRALANRLHPDRNGGVGGPDDATHEQMAALNAAYEILIDPMLRRDYDATLEPMRVTATHPLAEGQSAASFDGATAASMGDSQLERPWQGQPPLRSQTVWSPSPKRILLWGGVGSVVVLLVAAMLWRMDEGEHPLDRSIAAQAIRQPGVAQDDMTPSGQPTAVVAGVTNEVRRPTVDELARMSDEELVKALPALDGKPVPRAAVPGQGGAAPARGPHVLDGSPIRLRVETRLVDPLAPAPAAKPQP